MVNDPLCPECNDTHEIPETRLVARGPEDVDETETVICLSCPQCAQCDRFVSRLRDHGLPVLHIDDLWFCGDDHCLRQWVSRSPRDYPDLHAERVLRIAMEFTRQYLDGEHAPDTPRDPWNDDGDLLILANAVTRFRREASRQVSHHAMLSRIEAENAEIERAALEAGESTEREATS